MSFKKYLLLLFGIAALLRIIFAFGLLGAMPLTADPLSYSNEAISFLKEFPPSRHFFWPPGNPLLIAGFYRIFGTGIEVARFQTILLGALNCVLTAVLARQVFKNERVARMSGWISAVYPSMLISTGQTAPIQPMLFCLLAIAALCLSLLKEFRLWKVFLLGISFGAGCLIRPSALSVVAALGIVALICFFKKPANLFIDRKRLAGLLGSFGLAAMIILPAMQHNAQYGAGWTISTNNELNFLFGNNPYTPHYKTSHFGQRDLDSLEPEATAYFRRFIKGDARLLQLSDRQAASREAWRYIIDHPAITILRTLNRIRAFWGADYAMSRGIQLFYGLGFKQLALLLFFESGGYIVTMGLALAGLAALFKKGLPFEVKLLILLVISYQLPYMIAFSAASYHAPVMGFMIIFAAYALDAAFKKGWKSVFLQRNFLVAAAIFLIIQIEHAYFVLLLA